MEFMNGSNKTHFKFVRSLTAHHAKSFYFSASLLPKQKRWATFALYGFCRYVDNLIDNPRDRSAEEILNELDYLQREIETSYRTGESEHPIIKPFISVVRHYQIPKDHPLELIEGVRMDTYKDRYESFDELYLFAYRVAGVVGLMMAPLLGFKDPKTLEHAEKLGVAMQLTNILRDIKEDKEMNRIYLPLDEMQQFNLTPNDIFSERVSTKFRNFMKFQIDRAHQFYNEADRGIKMLDTDAQFAIYSASKIYRGILKKIELHNYNPFLDRVYVPQGKKARIVLGEILRTKVLSFAGLFS
jgi:phytoene synthase